MKRIHYLVIKSFIGPLILTFFLVIFILLMQFLWKYIDDLVGKGLEMKILGEFLLYSSASMVPMALPLAILLASLMTFGNMGENLELLAMKTSGVSLSKIMQPLYFVVAILTLTAFFFANSVMPVSNLKLRSLLYDIQRQRPDMHIQPGVFDNTMEGYSIRIGENDSRTNLLRDIWIYDHTDKAGNISVTVADSGYMRMSNDEKHLKLILYSGQSYVEMQKTKGRNRSGNYPHRRDKFDKQELILEMTGFGLNRTDQNLFRNSFSMMNINQLSHFEDSISNDVNNVYKGINSTLDKNTFKKKKKNLVKMVRQVDTSQVDIMTPHFVQISLDSAYSMLSTMEKRRAITQAINFARTNKSFVSTNTNTISYKLHKLRRYQIEKQRKFTLSFACLIFFFIGAPLGAIIRKGGLGIPIIVSVVFFLVYYMISITGEKFAREDMLSIETGMWISSLILVPLGIFLTYKAANDSVILNIETYLGFFKKINEKLKKQVQRAG
jgi:lipopolysaccharide export system permease protein